MILLRCCILALIIFIPLITIQHFIPFVELHPCLLADICNHTWIPECGFYEKRNHTRLFIDECDLHEYNCDNNYRYRVTNYSDCFLPAGQCPYVPKLLTRVQDFYIYYADGRRMLNTPTASTRKKFVYTPPMITETERSTLWHERRRYTPDKTGSYKPWTDEVTPGCGACGRQHQQMTTVTPNRMVHAPLEILQMLQQNYPLTTKNPTTKKTTKRTAKWSAKRSTKRTTNRNTNNTKKAIESSQMLQSGTIGTVVVNKVTFWKNGKKFYKIFKGYKTTTTTTSQDSDFLE